MSDTAGQKAMLNFVEILMNSGGPLTISQLAGHFGSRNFDAEMRAAAGGNEAGLKKLLLKFPSLFTVKGNLVGLYSQEEEDRLRSQSPLSDVTSEPGLPDISVELEAVRYFQGKFARRRERWMPIASLAGHLSQASRAVRNAVGPQLQFQNWLHRHPHIFELSDNMVGLQEDIAAVVLNTEQSQFIDNVCHLAKPKERQDDIWKLLFVANGNKATDESLLFSPIHRKNRIDQMDGEYAAVLYLVNFIDKHEVLGVEDLCKYVNEDAPGNVQNALNNVGLEKFLQDHAGVFSVEDGNVKLTQSRQASEETGSVDLEMIKEGTGKIYHVAKLWGIIDLGQHEHVFFDRSILESDLPDLQAEYKIGETLCFRAIAAPKKSRAKWKAVRIWKPENVLESVKDELRVMTPTGEEMSEGELSLASPEDINHSGVLRNEIRIEVIDETGKEKYEGSGNLSVERDEGDDGSFELTDESGEMVGVDRQGNSWRDETKPEQPKRCVSVGCQTMSTGDIIATNLYQST